MYKRQVDKGLCEDNQVARDLFDTRLMGVLTPFPHEVRARFRALYAQLSLIHI